MFHIKDTVQKNGHGAKKAFHLYAKFLKTECWIPIRFMQLRPYFSDSSTAMDPLFDDLCMSALSTTQILSVAVLCLQIFFIRAVVE